MFTNRLFTTLIMVTLATVVGLTVQQVVFTSAAGSRLEEAQRLNHIAETARWQAMGEFYARQAQAQRLKEAQPYIMNSSTRSYTAWAKAAEVSTVDSATRSYIAQAKAVTCGMEATYSPNLDSAARSYLAWGFALQAKNDIASLCH